MLFLKEGKSNITVAKLIERCFDHPKFNDYCSVTRQKKGDILRCKEGNDFKIYFILSGIYGSVIEDEKPKGGITRFLGKHDSFGLYHLYYDAWEPNILLQSLGHGEVMEVESTFLFSILDQEEENGFFMIQYLADELREAQYFSKLSFLKKEERIRKALLKCGLEFGTLSDQGIILPRQITQEVIARYTNTSREYVAHTVMKLIEDEIIRNRPKPLLILDRKRL
ncbi:cyclic nucleotide-binding protein [Listeria weihenstephanensis FSL R9-0317]|uniref:Crp/Fnr family transcriptional regulator n=1 Tax=Listeria weihenstephanensis TaxID=1006155 RepID=A0A1S7FQN1_9LIST|nr:Crp/Fnr family transcriptional regulator [Listeria weihenstephanensis]AQY49714.1 cyclic nucleotide-binding protein [Listeria weihenstephanensis]EUJ41002.1 cyclic nucleotide-binding protein [Listeria weihenstephanensis FSL R9-0317]MBC1499084.1 Crp/Fnr family transcriptional regulator [Listeria weihenstephanensis]